MTLPHGTQVEAELAGKPASRGVPGWIWALLAVAGLAAAYFLFLRPNPSNPEPSLTANESTRAEPSRDPEPTAKAPETTPQTAPESPGVLNAIEPLPQRPAPASVIATPAPVKPTPSPATATATAPSTKPATEDAAPAPIKPRATKTNTPVSAISAWAPKIPESQPIAAPAGADEGVTSIGSVVESPAAPPAPAPSVIAGSLVDATELDTTPVSLSRKLPVYSMQARQLRVQGTVVMKVLVNERGTVDDVTLVQGVPGADVNDAAMRAARAWTYRPATKSGVPVKTWKVEQVTFKM